MEIPGAIRRFATCSTTPDVFVGTITDDAILLPTGGGWVTSASVVRDVDVPGACLAARSIEVENTFAGSVVEEIAGRALVLGWCAASTGDFTDNRPGHLRIKSPPYSSDSGLYSPLVDCADKRIAWLFRRSASP